MYKEGLSSKKVLQVFRRAIKDGHITPERTKRFIDKAEKWHNSVMPRVTRTADSVVSKQSLSVKPGKTHYIPSNRNVIKEYIRAWNKTMKGGGEKAPFVEIFSGVDSNTFPSLDKRTIIARPNWQAIVHEVGHNIDDIRHGNVFAHNQSASRLMGKEIQAWRYALEFLRNSESWKNRTPEFKSQFFKARESALDTYRTKLLSKLLSERL